MIAQLYWDGVTNAVDTEIALFAPASGKKAECQIVFVNQNSSGTARVKVIHRPADGPTEEKNYIVWRKGVPYEDERVTFTFEVQNPEEVLVMCDSTGVSCTLNYQLRDVT